MDYKTIKFGLNESGIATLTMNRPQASNAFNAEMIAEMTHALESCADNKNARLLQLRAAGSNFSAGADIHWMKSMAGMSYEENQQDAAALAKLMHRLYQLPIPSIAVVNGAAYGGAIGLIACCDMAFAGHVASFALSEVKLGLVPAVISPYVISAIGARNASRYFLTAEAFGTEVAAAIGLITEACNDDDLEPVIDKLTRNILNNGPQALKSAKKLIRHVAQSHFNDELREFTADLIAGIRVSPEGQEGLNAFLEKRKPVWGARQQ